MRLDFDLNAPPPLFIFSPGTLSCIVHTLVDRSQIIDQRNEFLRNAPFTAEVSVEEALALIAQYREAVKMIRAKENDMKAGLGIFAIEPPANAETASTEVELDLLDQVWSMMANWTKNMDQWKTGKFASMNVPEIETVAADFGKQITKLAKEFKGGTGGNWKVGAARGSKDPSMDPSLMAPRIAPLITHRITPLITPRIAPVIRCSARSRIGSRTSRSSCRSSWIYVTKPCVHATGTS